MTALRSTRIEINLSAIRHNYNVVKTLSKSKAFAVIKSNAYGHGAVRVANALSEVDGFAVVSTFEAMELREAGISQPILVMQGPQSFGQLTLFSAHDLMPVLHHEDQIGWFKNFADNTQLRPWLKVDTGMGRLGVSLTAAAKLLQQADIQWHGVMTHFACADEPENPHTTAQISAFKKLVAGCSLETSMSNSAAIIAWPQAQSHWCRPGLMLYGASPLGVALPGDLTLQPAMRVSAPLLAVKNFASGAGIGYGQKYVCSSDSRVGFLGIGYGDGVPRVLDASASVRIANTTAPIIGRVSMDSIAVDLSQVPDSAVSLGDLADIWGPEHSVDGLATAAGTISYEMFTGIRGNTHYLE